MSQINDISQQIKQGGIIAIVRGSFTLEQIHGIGEALNQGGVLSMEVTLNTPDALTAIQQLRARHGGQMLVGAGTVRTVEQVRRVIEAGAQFIVSPNYDPASVAYALGHDTLHLPGVTTATEAQNAFVAGCAMVKLFPADVLGGVAYLKALRAPLDDIDFVPTGGIGSDNIAAYRRAGAAAVGVGSTLVSDKVSLSDLQARAAALRMAWDGAHV